MTKEEREVREYTSLFTDERYAKKAWKEIMGAALESDGKPLPETIDPKTNLPTFQSQLDQEAYMAVKNRLQEQGLSREPMQAELIIQSNILRARFSDTTFNTLLDRTAGKVKDEINVTNNQFEELTDEELEVLMAHRKAKENAESQEQK